MLPSLIIFVALNPGNEAKWERFQVCFNRSFFLFCFLNVVFSNTRLLLHFSRGKINLTFNVVEIKSAGIMLESPAFCDEGQNGSGKASFLLRPQSRTAADRISRPQLWLIDLVLVKYEEGLQLVAIKFWSFNILSRKHVCITSSSVNDSVFVKSEVMVKYAKMTEVCSAVCLC